MIMAAADNPGSTEAWPAGKRDHLQACDRCRTLLRKHQRLLTALSGDWGQRAIAVRTPYSPPTSRRQLLGGATGVAVVAVLAIAAAGTWARLSSRPSAPPASTPNPSFAVYKVNPAGTSVDPDRCISPADAYGRTQDDWGEDFLSNGAFYINFTGQPDAHVADIRALVPSDCAVFVRIVPVSSSVGRALQSQISADMASLNAANVPVWGVYFDPITDRVVVSVYPMTTATRAALEERYPAEIIEIVDAPPPVPVAS
jgi:hypothetical protein